MTGGTSSIGHTLRNGTKKHACCNGRLTEVCGCLRACISFANFVQFARLRACGTFVTFVQFDHFVLTPSETLSCCRCTPCGELASFHFMLRVRAFLLPPIRRKLPGHPCGPDLRFSSKKGQASPASRHAVCASSTINRKRWDNMIKHIQMTKLRKQWAAGIAIAVSEG